MLRILLFLLLSVVALPLLVVGCLRLAPPPITSFMLQSEVKPIRYQWVPAERIADAVRNAVVASEDQKFWDHGGFDFEAMEKAYRHNQKRSRKRGASTISQQTAKNLFLWPGGGYLRKGIEAWLTLLLEWLWPKERILEMYLNIAEFGPGIYGVEAAARHHFDKPASGLTPTEAARLAAVLPNPRHWHASQPGPYVMKRTAWILRQMGYRPRPPTVPDPEPAAPEDMEADQPDAPADPPRYEEITPDEGFETFPDEPESEADDGPAETPGMPASENAGEAPPSRPREGGRVVDEDSSVDDSEGDPSLIY